MKKLITILFFLSFVVLTANAQHPCTPTQTGPVPNPGALVPQSLPDGMVGVLYNELLQLGFRDSATVGTMTVFITDVTLQSLVGMPAGLAAYCAAGGAPPCTAMVPATWYCYTLYGTPTTATTGAADSIDANIIANVSLSRGGAPFPFTTTASFVFGQKIPIRILPSNVGIDEITAGTMKLYPNPSNGMVGIELNTNESDVVNIRVYDAIGTLVYSRLNIETSNHFNTMLNLQQLPVGMYYVEVKGNQINKVNRLMIQK